MAEGAETMRSLLSPHCTDNILHRQTVHLSQSGWKSPWEGGWLPLLYNGDGALTHAGLHNFPD